MQTCHALPLVLAAAVAASPLDAWADGGTIRGVVEATPAKYLEDTVVYLKEVPGAYAPRSHALDQKGMRFQPRLLAITAGDTVRFQNHDGVAHNVYSPDGEGYNLGAFQQSEERSFTFRKPGVYAQLCSVHPEMLGYVFVGQNPFAAVVDKAGRFEIREVPPGTYALAVWNVKLKAAEQSVAVAGGQVVELRLALQR